MQAVNDLQLEKEVLLFFDFTLNSFARTELLNMHQTPLKSTNEIEERQQIIRAFVANKEAFHNFFYARQDFNEVYNFLTDYPLNRFEKGGTLKLLFSEADRTKIRSRLVQLVLLLVKLETGYIKKIKPDYFPEQYKGELTALKDFMTGFNLAHYDNLIREDKLANRHLLELIRYIISKHAGDEIKQFYKRLSVFEAYCSVSIGMIKQDFRFPGFVSNGLVLQQVYHPLVKNAVKNDFSTDKNVVLLTGPNMSGKSTFLKAVGLCIYLGHLGFPVPADKAEIPFFDQLTISISHNDDISSGLSHFMNEIFRLKKVVVAASENKACFAIFDELFKGTNVDDSVQVSAKTIAGLTKFKNSLFFISTHLHQLKEIAVIKNKEVDTYYVDCDIKNATPVFNYTILKGWSDLKVGQLLFAKEGLNELLERR